MKPEWIAALPIVLLITLFVTIYFARNGLRSIKQDTIIASGEIFGAICRLGCAIILLTIAVAGIGAIFTAYSAVSHISMNGFGPMLIPLLGLGILGHLSTKRADKGWLYALAAIIFAMAMTRGFYWHPFARGHGFFTANRTTAIVLFFAAFIAPTFWAKWQDRRP